MALDFPNSPTNGSTYTSGIGSWIWDGTKWNAASTQQYVPIAGGTMTGLLILSADPTAALGAATKQYVDVHTGSGTYLPLTGGTLTGLLTISNASYAQINYLNTTAPIAAGGLWRTYVGTGGNFNIQTNTAAAGDFSTQIVHAFTATGALGIGVAPPSDAYAGAIFPTQGVIFPFTSANGVIATNVYRNGSKILVAGPAQVLNMGDGTFQFYTAPSAAAGSSPAWTRTAYIDASGNFSVPGTITTTSNNFYGNAIFLYYVGDTGSSTTRAGLTGTSWRFIVSSGDESNAGSINYRGIGGSDALNIIGAGPASTGVRIVRIYDQLQVEYSGTNALVVSGQAQINGMLHAANLQVPFQTGSLSSDGNMQRMFTPDDGVVGAAIYTTGNFRCFTGGSNLSFSTSGTTLNVVGNFSSGGSTTGRDLWCTQRDGSANGCTYISGGLMRLYYNSADRIYIYSGGDVQVGMNGGTLYVRSGSGGYVQLYPGDASNAGYSRYYTSEGTSRGYVGYGGSAGLNITGENPSQINFYANNLYGNGYYYGQDVRPQHDNGWSVGVSGDAWAQVASYWMNSVSGRAKKRDVEVPAPGALDKVMALQPKQFRWRENFDYETKTLIGPDDRLHRGFIADEVLAVMGDKFAGYHCDKDGNEGIAYNELTAVLWQAVQELAAEVAILKGRS